MQLASILDQYHDAFLAKYGPRLLPGHLRAIDAIRRCRTPEAGEVFVHCPRCHHSEWRPHSCGHRSCPRCQNHEASVWLDRQQEKLLPVEYFMVTFTLPYELRSVAWNHQKRVYDLLFACASRLSGPARPEKEDRRPYARSSSHPKKDIFLYMVSLHLPGLSNPG